MFSSPFSIAITRLGEEIANLVGFALVCFCLFPLTLCDWEGLQFVRFALVWFCLFPLHLGVWEGLRFVIVPLPGLLSYLCFLLMTAFIFRFSFFVLFYKVYLFFFIFGKKEFYIL